METKGWEDGDLVEDPGPPTGNPPVEPSGDPSREDASSGDPDPSGDPPEEQEKKEDPKDRSTQMFEYALKRLQSTSCLELRKSGIHGVGVFSTRPMAKGSQTFCGPPDHFTLDPTLFNQFPEKVRSCIQKIMPDTPNAIPLSGTHCLTVRSFLNHASDPVAELQGNMLVFLKDISANTEVTIKYEGEWEALMPKRKGKKKR